MLTEERWAHRIVNQPQDLISSVDDIRHLSSKYGVSEEDVLMIGLNGSGIEVEELDYDRGRFVMDPMQGRKYFTALTITSAPLSPFKYKEGDVLLGEQQVGSGGPINKDTCLESYWRANGHQLTLNSNSRSHCKGCKFCGSFRLESQDRALSTVEDFRQKALELSRENNSDLSELEAIGLVTGCFPSERDLVTHLTNLRLGFSELGFKGEIRYIGSQLRSREALERLREQGPLGLHLTVESFSRREKLMKKTKASLDLDSGREMLDIAKGMGIDTSFLYIAGLDSLDVVKNELPKYQDVLTRLPQIQVFQAYRPSQLELRVDEARTLDYFLEMRKIVESIFPSMHPDPSNNYRSLWYRTYNGQLLPNPIS